MILKPVLALAKYLVKAELPSNATDDFLSKYPEPTQENLQDFIDEKQIEDADDIEEMMYELDSKGIQDLKTPRPAEKDWTKVAIRELAEELEIDLEDLSEGNDFGDDYFTLEAIGTSGNNGESEWIIYKDNDAAEYAAKQRIREDLEENPEYFNKEFILRHAKMTPTNIGVIANDEADSYYTDMDESEVLRIGEDLQLRIGDGEEDDEENFDDIKTQLIEIRAEEIRTQLEDNPLSYFEDLYGEGEEATKAFLDNAYIDKDAAAQEAVDSDGIAHYLDNYDGNSVDLPSGAEAYGTN